MKRFAMFICVVLPVTVFAGSIKSAKPQVDKHHWDVKGATLGRNKDELAKALAPGELQCDRDVELKLNGESISGAEEKDIGITERCSVKGEHKCTSWGMCYDDSRADTFAGNVVRINYWLRDGVLWEISIAPIYPAAFDETVAAMESKYGKAAVLHQEIQNKMGAKFEQGVAVWSGLDHIVYEKYQDRLDSPSLLRFYSDAAWAELERVKSARRDAEKSDM